MSKNAFTLVELIAVIVIMSIIALIATPNIVKMSTNSKKQQYATDVKDFAINARYMYKLERYKNNDAYFVPDPDIDGTVLTGGHKIMLSKIKNVDTDDLDDPYNCVYYKNVSYIAILNATDDQGFPTVKYVINVISKCESADEEGNEDKPHCIKTGVAGALEDINLLGSDLVMDEGCVSE